MTEKEFCDTMPVGTEYRLVERGANGELLANRASYRVSHTGCERYSNYERTWVPSNVSTCYVWDDGRSSSLVEADHEAGWVPVHLALNLFAAPWPTRSVRRVPQPDPESDTEVRASLIEW